MNVQKQSLVGRCLNYINRKMTPTETLCLMAAITIGGTAVAAPLVEYVRENYLKSQQSQTEKIPYLPNR